MKLDDLPLLEVPAGIGAVAVLTLGLPGHFIDSVWWVLPAAIVAVFAALFSKWREPRAASFALAGGLAVFTALHAVNRFAGPAASPEWVEVLEVGEPTSKHSGYTAFRRKGHTERLEIQSGWGSRVGEPLQLTLHDGALGLRWAE